MKSFFNISLINFLSLLFFFMSLLMFYISMILSMNFNKIFLEWSIVSNCMIDISFPFFFDFYSCFFSGTVLFISSLVMLFSKTYMVSEIFFKRFIYLVLLFVFSMEMLIFIPHLMFLLLGWDGLGLSSFLLIIYYMNSKSLSAGGLTMVFNRIGDVFLLLSIGFMLNSGHWVPFLMNSNFSMSYLSITLMIAAMTKSAQIPFCSWLPAAMAAPTPVSALVHSSTLVTAGVFILFRFYNILFSVSFVNNFLLMVSSLTMIFAGLCAYKEMDMKKVIALSTLSNLGIMISGLSLGLPYLAFYHLITHAMFKALLFICAGYLIDFKGHSQDMRFMGDIFLCLPMIGSGFIISNFALCGFPFMSGFYSKDLIMESMFFFSNSFFLIFLYFLGMMLTSFYSIRLLLNCVWNKNLFCPFSSISESLLFSSFPIFFLSLGGIFSGSFIFSEFISYSSSMSLFFLSKLLPLFMMIFGVFLGLIFNLNYNLVKMKFLDNWSTSLGFLNPMSTQMILFFIMNKSKLYLYMVDMGWFEFCLPKVFLSFYFFLGKINFLFQNEFILISLSSMVFFFLILMVLMF